MTFSASISLDVPATTANLGPGFDCIGAALSLYNTFHFRPTDGETTIQVTGEEASRVSTGKDNLLYQSFSKFYQTIAKNPPHVAIEIVLGVPLARGLGSSATAIVGGLVAGNIMAGNPLNQQEIMELAITCEGHPDNVVPALLGNCRLCVGEAKNWQICEIPWHSSLIPIVAIPNFELSTEEARSALPNQYTRSDAIFNTSRLGLLLRGLETGNKEWLTLAMEDKIHQPYRQGLIKGYEGVKQAAIEAGAYNLVISGAGPTLLALSDGSQADKVALAMKITWERAGVQAEVKTLTLDTIGVSVH
ncbi:MAG: homoserine kinase [Microcystaceae cyanobacterium]